MPSPQNPNKFMHYLKSLNYYKILKHFTIGVDILFITLLLFNYLNYLPEFWGKSIVYIFFLILTINTAYLASKINKIPEHEKEHSSIVYLSKYFFLLGLIVITLNQFLKKQIIIEYMTYVTGIVIVLGFLTFYASRNRVEQEIEQEKTKEEADEKIRKNEFSHKFPRINKIWGLRSIVKWMYKEGWWYSLALIAIVVLGFVLRVWNLDYLQGAENFNILSAKALFQTGHFVYTRNLQITYTLAFLFKLFGATLTVARIPFVFIGTLSILLIYFLGRFINKKIGIISSFLLAISPVAIEKSSFVREYTENFFWVLLLTIILIYIFIKYKDKPKKFFIIYLVTFIIGMGILYVYGNFVGNETIMGVLLAIGFLTVPIFLFVIKQNYKRLFFPASILSIIAFGLLISFANIFSSIFAEGFVYNNYWFKMFFDPMVKFPMQWFSFSTISSILLVGLFLFSLAIRKNREIVIIMNLVFWSTIILFIFKFYSSLGYYWSRYLYHLYPVYIIIFAIGLFYFLKSIKKSYNKIMLVLTIIFLLVMVIIPQNTIHGAEHDLFIWSPINPDLRQSTTTGNADYFYKVINLLEQNNFSNKDAIVIRGENQFYISWYFNYTINRTFMNKNSGSLYDTGDKVYIIYPSYNLNELDLALNKYSEGYLLSQSKYFGIGNFTYNNVSFNYLDTSEGYYLYKWNK